MEETLNNTGNKNSNKNTSFVFRFVYGRAEILILVNFSSKRASGVKKEKYCSCLTGVSGTEMICPDPPEGVYGLSSIHQV